MIEAVTRRGLGTTADGPAVGEALADLIWSPDVSNRIMAAGGNPAAAAEAVRRLFRGPAAAAAITAAAGDSDALRTAVGRVLKSDPGRRSLTVYRSVLQEAEGRANLDALSTDSETSLTALIDDIDDLFAPADTGPRPRSVEARILYLRLLGMTWQEIEAELEVPRATIYSRGKKAEAELRKRWAGGDQA